MPRKSPEQYGRAPRYYRPADRLEYAIVPRPLADRTGLYTAGRYSADGKLALISSLAADPNRPTPPAEAWRWMSVD